MSHLLPYGPLLPLQGADKIKKIKNKLSLASTEKRRGYEDVYVRRTIMILLSNSYQPRPETPGEVGCQENIMHTVGGGIPVLPSSPVGGARGCLRP